MVAPERVTKRSHTVPRLYLEAFADPEGWFWVYSKPDGLVRREKPENSTIERYFYAYDRADGGKVDPLEKYFANELEPAAKRVLLRWREPRAVPSRDEIEDMATIMAYFHLRVRRTLRASTEIYLALLAGRLEESAGRPKELESLLQDWRKDIGDPDLDLGKLQTWASSPETFRPTERFRQAMVQTVAGRAPTVRDQLLTMNWCLCEAPSGSLFVTGDTPVSIIARQGYGPILGFGGFGLSSAEVALPITPSVVVFLDRRRSSRRRRVSASFVKEINRRTAFVAEREIISPVKTRAVSQLLAQSRGTWTEPKMDQARLLELYRELRRAGARTSEPGLAGKDD